MVKSKWFKYLGIATTAILNNNDRIIEVYCPDFLPTLEGIMSKADTVPKKKQITIDSPLGEKNTASVGMGKTIKCEYMGSDTNKDVPDIHIGEQVWVHNYAGTETFYWSCADRDDNIRRVEHYKISIADQQKTNKVLTDDNTYLFEMDTRNGKLIRFKTSWSDGEEYIYQFHVDAVTNMVTLWDTNKAGEINLCQIDSNIPMIRALNRSKTYIELRDKDINMYAPRDWNVIVDRHANFIIGGNLTSTIKGDATSTILGKLISTVIKDVISSVTGNVTFTYLKNMTLTVTQTVTQTCKDWTVTVANAMNLTGKKGSVAIQEGGKILHPPG